MTYETHFANMRAKLYTTVAERDEAVEEWKKMLHKYSLVLDERDEARQVARKLYAENAKWRFGYTDSVKYNAQREEMFLSEIARLRAELNIAKDHNRKLIRNLGLEIGTNNLLTYDWLTQEEIDIIIELQNE